MKSITKILLAAALLTGANYTFANTHEFAKVKTDNTVQDRHLTGFNAVDAAGSFDVYIVQSGTESVRVEAPADVIDKIVTEVEGGELKIHDKNNSGWNWSGLTHKKIAVYVSVKDINSIGITGSGNVFFKEGIRANSLKVRVSGSGDVFGKVDVKSLEASISGSGDMKLSGHAETSTIHVSGSGDFTAKELATVNTSVHVTGSGDAAINVSGSLDASVSGSGDISYTGGAQHVVKSKSGSGDISGN
ncbi:head GIN domain-containing protein [Mucilaginibacter sp. X5P1]|uniref:head GIN domain-containing protein n=1 Tax=Mucilaginibacter sp. X5P1 TaxID=2723088 RepID=UPI00160BD221|nr:head GIN domain-containing protein [Mucilaginibacter sp. X5P1]MBB6141332.1 hypothetical protein [Mucilaginibacter sp. X5P1]